MECRLSQITVHYESFGRGRPLVVLPGWPDDWTVPADYLEPVMRSRPGWRRIYLDLPGRGRTDGASWITTNDQVLEILLQVLDRVIPGERFVVAGHSAGGYLARAVLHRRISTVDGLLQVVPEFPDDEEELPDPGPLVADPELVERIRLELGPDLATAFASRLVVQTPEIYERFKTLVPGFSGHDSEFLAELSRSLSFDVDRLPTPFLRPALFVLGRQDRIVGYRGAFGLADQYPRATVAVLDRSGHALPWEQEDLFQALLVDWLMRVEESGATESTGGA